MDSRQSELRSIHVVSAASSKSAFVLDAADAKLLTEIGFIAAYRGDVARTDAIFDALASIRPGRAYPWVGKALARFHVGRANEAAQFLEQVASTDEDEAALLQAWRGLALQLSGHAGQARTLLEQLTSGTGPGHVLARSLLGLPEGN